MLCFCGSLIPCRAYAILVGEFVLTFMWCMELVCPGCSEDNLFCEKPDSTLLTNALKNVHGFLKVQQMKNNQGVEIHEIT